MNDDRDDEVFERAMQARADLRKLNDLYDIPEHSNSYARLEENLEMIARRTDPARHPDYDPGEAQADD